MLPPPAPTRAIRPGTQGHRELLAAAWRLNLQGDVRDVLPRMIIHMAIVVVVDTGRAAVRIFSLQMKKQCIPSVAVHCGARVATLQHAATR